MEVSGATKSDCETDAQRTETNQRSRGKHAAFVFPLCIHIAQIGHDSCARDHGKSPVPIVHDNLIVVTRLPLSVLMHGCKVYQWPARRAQSGQVIVC